QRAGRRRAGAGVHGPATGHLAARDRGGHGVPRLLHQRPDRGPAGRRRGAARPAGGRLGADAGGPRLDAGQGAGRGRGAGRGVPGRRRPVAQRRLLDVPGDDPGPARSRRALGVHLEPQLRGPAGQGRAYPPGLAAGRRRHRRRRPPGRTGGPELTGPIDAQEAPMQEFTTHTGRAVPLRRSNVDTDQIIPAVYLKRVSRTGFEDGLFAAWRAAEPDFVLNQPRYAGASVLVAGPDFGTGSSREHAVWALQDHGFKAVLSPRFGDIFRGNALKGGLLAVVLPQPVVDDLWQRVEHDPELEVTVDLVTRQVRYAGTDVEFELDDYTRWRLLEGLDDIALTLQHGADIAAFEQRRPSWLPATA